MPSGPLDAKVMIIGEGPGYNENKIGIGFVGQSGKELDYTYLPLAGLKRSEVFVTNAVQCRCEKNGKDIKPNYNLTDMCAINHLREELSVVKPEVVVLCGATAYSIVHPKRTLEMEHGFPAKAYIFDWHGWIVPMYHPAAGMHLTRLMIPLLDDWRRFGKWLEDKWPPTS